MDPKFACADFTFPLLSHDNVLQLIAMLGFEGVDIGLFEERSHLWPSREFEDVSGSARLLKQKLSDRGPRGGPTFFLQMGRGFLRLMQSTIPRHLAGKKPATGF